MLSYSDVYKTNSVFPHPRASTAHSTLTFYLSQTMAAQIFPFEASTPTDENDIIWSDLLRPHGYAHLLNRIQTERVNARVLANLSDELAYAVLSDVGIDHIGPHLEILSAICNVPEVYSTKSDTVRKLTWCT